MDFALGVYQRLRQVKLKFRANWGRLRPDDARVVCPDPCPICKQQTRKQNRVGGGVAPAVLPHHRTYGSRIRRFLSTRFRGELTSRGLFARWPIDAATALGTSGPYCFVASSLSGQLSRLNGEIATFPLSADSALHDLVRAAIMASADSRQSIPTPRDVSSTWQIGGPPRVMRVTFMLMPVGSTS